jgi:hypothetical protein
LVRGLALFAKHASDELEHLLLGGEPLPPTRRDVLDPSRHLPAANIHFAVILDDERTAAGTGRAHVRRLALQATEIMRKA